MIGLKDRLETNSCENPFCKLCFLCYTENVMCKDKSISKSGYVAVFDSGLGGLSVLHALKKCMPGERYLYFGDSIHAPYGEKEPKEILRLCVANVERLLSQGAKCIVVACNTATSAAVPYLRTCWSDLPIIGMEPAVKPAAKSDAHPRVLVMATPVTIHGNRLHQLVQNYDAEAEFILLEAPEIVRFVEHGATDRHPTEALKRYLHELLADYCSAASGENRPVDAVVLGCTHFPFVRGLIQQTFDHDVGIFDGTEGTAMQTRRRLLETGLLSDTADSPDSALEKMILADWQSTELFTAGGAEVVPAGSVFLMNSDASKLELERNLFNELK